MKQIVQNYTFNPGTSQITLNDFGTISLGRLYLITNVSANQVIYQFNNPTLGGTATGNVVTLHVATTSMNSGDNLQIIYDCQTGDPLYDTASLNTSIQGNIASGSPDGGDPVKIGGVYRASQSTFSDGQRVDGQFDAHGNQLTSLGTALAGEDLTNNLLGVLSKYALTSAYSPVADTSFGTKTSNASKAIPGLMLGVYATNQNAALRYFQVFNLGATPAAGATPVWSFPIPAGSTTNPGVLQLPNKFFGDNGYYCNVGLAWGVSTTRATFTAATATDHDVNVQYA